MNESLAMRDDLELLTIRKVTELFGISRLSVHRLIHRGLIPVHRILSCVRFKRSDVIELLNKTRTAGWRDQLYGSKKD